MYASHSACVDTSRGAEPRPCATIISQISAVRATLTSRMAFMSGNRCPASISLSVVSLDNASAAARNKSSVTWDAPVSAAAYPSAGNTYALFACAGNTFTPSRWRVTGSNGEPLAKTTLPSVHRMACSNVHSALEVGFDSGKMIGRSFNAAMAFTTSSLNAPPMVLTPMSAVGLMASIADNKSGWYSTSCANATLCGCKPLSRLLHTNPFESIK
mmetsp:Transcript_3991/g.14503  ORF Transcript_3991/g.14503 Transcript_3991/m.14503 type:complete len:214 (+) Transcript_3991:196-837(+)